MRPPSSSSLNSYQEGTSSLTSNSLEEHQTPKLPAQFILRALGLWQPVNSHYVFKFYDGIIAIFLWLVVVGGIIAQCFLDSFTWGRLLNSIGTVCNLCAPFMICRQYLQNGRIEQLIHIIFDDERSRKMARNLPMFYTLTVVLTWSVGFTFFYIHFVPFFTSTYHYICYAFILLYSLGWWASWLGVYSFVCTIHKVQIENYIFLMKETYGYSSGSKTSEEKCIAVLLYKFTMLRESLEQTHQDFSKIISFCVGYHILDLVVFSIAYWKNSFGNYTLWQYIGGVLFDALSILFKLFPAALVNQTLHDVTRMAGELCHPNIYSQIPPHDRLLFHHFLFLREQDLGMRILGVKITSKLTVGIFVTLTSLGLAFLYYAVPFLATITIR